MSHEATGMSRMKYPANTFSESIAGIDGAFDVFEKDMSGALPVLDGEVLYVNVAGAFGRAPSIDHLDSRFIVLIEEGRGVLWETQLAKDQTKVFCHFGGSNGGNELGLGRAGGGYGLGFGTVSNDAASESKTIACGRAALAEVIAMGGVDIACKLERVMDKREGREAGRKIGGREDNRWES
jgi:hypothetical protein